jgi:hypothetical protein
MAKKKKAEFIEEATLRWPDGCERTRIIDRKPHAGWRKTRTEYRDALAEELQMMGAKSILITYGGDERTDPGVSVWFSMQKADFSWQQGLGFIDNPAPTVAEIDAAFKTKAMKYHPDNPQTGDPTMFKQFSEWRLAAKAWVQGTHNDRREHVMAIDQYKEIRLNLCALRLAFSYIRGLERVGAPAILDQALGAFRAKLTAGSGGPNGAAAA